MIFPTVKKTRKGKSVQAVADFSSTQNAKGKIVLDDSSNVNFTNGLAYAGAFVHKDNGVLQYLCSINGNQVTLKSSGLTMGIRTFTQLANCQNVLWTFDVNKNTLVVCSNSATYKIYSGNIQKIFDEAFDSLALCQSRLFALKNKRVYMSNPTEMTFADELWIDLPTNCVALVNNGELYALGNDVYKLDIDGDESHVKVKKLCSNVGNVQRDTVCAYGNKIIFVADGKIISLQNGSLKQLVNLKQSPVCATMHGGLYYLCCQADGKTTVTAYNTHSGKVVSTHKVDVVNLYSNGNDLLASNGTNGLQLSAEKQLCHWASQPINFDDQPTTKHLHRLQIQTVTDVDVHILSNSRRIYHLKGKDTPQSLLLVGHGKNITLELRSTGNLNVKWLTITARTSEVIV